MCEILKVKDIKKDNILKGISFSMAEGEMIAVMGPSGSGKSTLLYNVSGMDQASSGEVWLGGTEIVGLSEDDKARLRLHRMGFVFQMMNMLSNLNIIDNIVFPAVSSDKKNQTEYYERARTLMEKLNIESLAERKIKEVSGGELQRACICRSMILKPEILFADEPTGALNQTATAEVMDAFLGINREGTTIMMVTHDSKVASMCERILYMLDGEIKGELKLGKYEEADGRNREQRTVNWLSRMGW
ncbi:MAG TPA: ABC transporter ATP-binding protein [Lachnospiraceae bacterium]|nr:ABC transporter ATP-binding protein [Lachnospiraceae bacterium]